MPWPMAPITQSAPLLVQAPKLLSVLFLLPFLVQLHVSGVWDSNEAFYIQTPREMAERDDWIVPHFNHQPRLNKPPLTYWLVGSLQALIPDPIAAERWALALVAGASLFTCVLLGRLITESIAGGLLAMGILATSFRFLVLSRRLLIDTLLLLCLLAALTAFVDWTRSGRKLSFLLCAVFLSLGFLTKGPVVVVAVLIMLAYLALSGQWATLTRAPWLWALLALALICLPWYLLLARRLGLAVVLDFFLLENLGRFTYLDFGPRRGPLYYPGVFLSDFSPWSFFFLGSLPWWWRRLREEWKQRGLQLAPSRSILNPGTLMAAWILAWILILSFSRNKQEHYLLPIYPIAACWLAYWLKTVRVSRWWATIATIPVMLATLVLAALGMSLFSLSPAIWLLAVFPTVFWALTLSRRWLPAALCLSLFFLTTQLVFTERLEAYRPVRDFAAQIEALSSSDSRVGYFRFASPSLAVYLNRRIDEIHTRKEAEELFASSQEIWLVIEESELPFLQQLSSVPLQSVDRRPLLNRRLSDLVALLGSKSSNMRYALLIRRAALRE